MQKFALQDEDSQQLYANVSELLETTTRVIWGLRGAGSAESSASTTTSEERV